MTTRVASVSEPSQQERMFTLVLSAVRRRVEPLELARICGGYYSCPKDPSGTRRGPLVGYAGTYDTPDGPKNWIGDVYLNFAMIEQYGAALEDVASRLQVKLVGLRSKNNVHFDTLCGAPLGGLALATALAVRGNYAYVFPEKVVRRARTSTTREEADLLFSRHVPTPGSSVVLVEDVCNNFTTTADMIRMIHAAGAKCVAVACFLDRSSEQLGERVMMLGDGAEVKIPVVSLVSMPILQYRQDDPFVAADVGVGNLITKPKNEWQKLEQVMAEHTGQ